jgi:hypothetical protein
MDARALPRREQSGIPIGLRVAITLAVPVVGAISVAGIYLSQEVLVAAAWLALTVAALVFVQPLVGLAAMTATFMLVAYPTVLQTLGVLTLNNLFGVCLAVVLVAHVLGTRDLSVLRIPQVLLFAAIGILLLLSTAHADVIFPLLQQSQGIGGRGKILDRTADLTHDFWARFVYLVFFCSFVRSVRDVRVMLATFVLVLFLAVPSALINWMQGTLSHGFRAMASVTAGANANRLAMICLMQVACWWAWSRARHGTLSRAVATVAIGASFLVILATGSRSGFLGCGVLALLLQTGPRPYRVSPVHIGMVLLAGAIAVATVVPSQAWERMLTFTSEDRHAGAVTSVMAREQTLGTGLQMLGDHPFLGIGLGNFREVSRQVYRDPYFRPPHNSYLWAASEGGIFVLAGYLLIFGFAWRDLQVALRLAERDRRCADVAAALRVTFYLYLFFAFFADLWLNPITYCLIGLIVSLRRYLEGLPLVAPARRLPVALAST